MHTRESSSLRRLVPVLLAALLAGCAGTPEKPAAAPQKAEPAAAPTAPAEAKPAPAAEPLVLKPDYPQRYVVKKGDTLWDISARFLRDPWRWPELWYNNPYIHNPHLIYPGDVLTLVYIEGKPTLQVQRAHPTVRLEPQVREESLAEAIPTIPIGKIRQFLDQSRIVTEEQLKTAPYVLASSEAHLVAGSGVRIYARGIKPSMGDKFNIVETGNVYRNPANKDDVLGYEVRDAGSAELIKGGDPATLMITNANREVLNGDLLLPPSTQHFNQDFVPHAPDKQVSGHVLAVLDGVSLIGQYQVIAVDVGKDQGAETGTVLGVYQSGNFARDPVTGKDVKLPDERAGTVMIFRVFDRVSYALVMDATRSMHVLDKVANP